MKIAITGGDGFLGKHAARLLERRGHQVVRLSRRSGVDLADVPALRAALVGCDAVVHAAGINRELGGQTFDRVHRRGTANVLAAAAAAGVRRVVYVSFLRARPGCGSPYHQSKWDAEEMVRASGLEYVVLKPGIVYGPGDHMLDHLSRTLKTLPVFALMGREAQPMRPAAVDDVAEVIAAACFDPRLARKTVAVVGPEEMTLRAAVERVAAAHGLQARFVRAPLWVHRALAACFEFAMVVPLAAKAQVRILSETLTEPLPACDALPDDLRPRARLDESRIRAAQPAPAPFGLGDLRCSARVWR
jgi:NADH dehydrogenase